MSSYEIDECVIAYCKKKIDEDGNNNPFGHNQKDYIL